ncbi:MAG: hypothetical protein UT98_C0001G0123 [Candidatus Nomurabacteria bacterium GW2011_GWF2_40_31]|uniref:Uncharacterized protein n=2 Tax=Candidatus Nomuraibacteriota TaxID=1752729 RepID=A0A837HWA9_9BACT|nr:MAG: hypothetical protein UT27_C0001G0045 [Candidatus Nomurabacteria bacterium GW2011_GWD2_39_12]KKR20688.1 MAG: hypothetical protein UT51_C0002G0123 [Candidatus Nomurabacteria bacterium GW2011_GWC2_39_41]KKR37384.1 MAG: hypothetical protein UT70_C0001G0060 [Candidatus Nomurabacteria bacterium GW2011_GWE2_40_10]KKR38631.1 MAG: hypothetical protein UT73_C0002G0116 [Candidatus Nomurabacteria bacterium GW2011_GWB1_40_11]KKR40356.1 MAG: hypothetical protein UT74_C0001G0090 [Parcubacteria group b
MVVLGHFTNLTKIIMKTTTYRNHIASPFQLAPKKTFTKKDPLKEELLKNTGTFNLTAIIEEDIQTSSQFKHIPGFLGYICTLKIGNEVIGIGRGSAILNRMNKFVERGIRFAYGASIVDAVVRSTKTLDALYLKTSGQENPGVLKEETGEIDYTPELATDKQKSYLRELININVLDDRERDQWASQIDELTKDEASEKIQFFMR